MSVSFTKSSQESTLRHGDTYTHTHTLYLVCHLSKFLDQTSIMLYETAMLWHESQTCSTVLEKKKEEKNKCSLTLEKSGGGFLPLHRLDRAHTAFLIMVKRFCLVKSL